MFWFLIGLSLALLLVAVVYSQIVIRRSGHLIGTWGEAWPILVLLALAGACVVLSLRFQ